MGKLSKSGATDRFSEFHERWVLRRPGLTLFLCTAIVSLFAWFAPQFSLDASADSLTLEQDASLDYYRFVKARYGSDDYLIVTFAPKQAMFSDTSLAQLESLRNRLRQLDEVTNVTSILDVPLIRSPPINLSRFADGIRTLEQPKTDRSLAKKELTGSPLYHDLLISTDAKVTALRVDLKQDSHFIALRDRRDELRERQLDGIFSTQAATELVRVSDEFDALSRRVLDREQTIITSIRAILDDFRTVGELHLGGVPMIVADSVAFIENDLLVFGTAVVVFLLVILLAAFRKPRWALLALVNCTATCVVMLGLLGLTDWRLTVVSSNFVSLLVILCLALTLHIIVKYREIHLNNPNADQLTLVREAVRHMIVPCLYTVITTMIAFASLIVSDIRPVMDFGWMMVIGLAIGFFFSFTLFPAALMFFRPGLPRLHKDLTSSITGFFARIIDQRVWQTITIGVVLTVAGLIGISQLTVENRFIDYYKRSTEIYQGMAVIDRELGGTTPLDVIIDAPLHAVQSLELDSKERSANRDGVIDESDTDFDDIFAQDDETSGGITSISHWFNHPNLQEVIRIHDFLDAIPSTGKVISIATTARLLSEIDPSVLSDNMALSLIYKKMPDEIRNTLINPYLSEDGNQLRFSIRVFESDPSLQRSALIERIRNGLVDQFGLSAEQIHLSGMLVLYNNMLQSLFRSQMLTLGAVFLAILASFIALFRSPRIAIVAIIPNVFAAILVLGLIGWTGIPLDLMTITIAAITVGIAVDDTIHYVHRFQYEIAHEPNAWLAIHRCHQSIGRAMYYTSLTIMLGFSILALSQFKPTIYFGVLTGTAMLIALLANLTLLPVLLARFGIVRKCRLPVI